jgi:lauroyl/myristoyl acyltransferase
MKLIFYIVSLIPIAIVRAVLSTISKTGLYKLSNAYKVTLRNLKMSYTNLNQNQLEKLALESFIETLVSWL